MTHDAHDDLDAILNDQNALLGDDGSLTPTRAISEPPLVLATNWELLDVLEGRELTFTDDEGGKVRIRLYNVDELLRAQKAASLTLEAETGTPGPGLTRQKAIELCMPLSEIMRHQVRRS